MSRIIAATVLAASLATSVSAHARVWTWSVDGVDANTGSGIAPFIRTPPNNNPVKDLTSTDVRCNVGGTTAVSAKFSAKAGSKLTPEWFQYALASPHACLPVCRALPTRLSPRHPATTEETTSSPPRT